MLNPDYEAPEFRPYVLAFGHVALAWNGWHDALALLFTTVCGDVSSRILTNIWNSAKSDRAQRDMLAAAVGGVHYEKSEGPEHVKKHASLIRNDIIWILNKVNELEDLRNDILHSPLIIKSDADGHLSIEPNSHIGHRRALKLSSKNELLRECEWFRNAALTLRDLTIQMQESLHARPHGPIDRNCQIAGTPMNFDRRTQCLQQSSFANVRHLLSDLDAMLAIID